MNRSVTQNRPFAFILSYVRRRKTSHIVIISAILAAVACATGTQYGVKSLVDALSSAPQALGVWSAFALLVSLIAADNLLWRIAGWISSSTFVGVTGDLRRDLFRHLTGHSLSYFADRGPGHVDEPHHRSLECHLHDGEFVHLERAAALRRDRWLRSRWSRP